LIANSARGNFLFSAATMWDEIERLEPLMAEAAKASVAASTHDHNRK
jgi:mannose-1-phosphate guanylyltransferase